MRTNGLIEGELLWVNKELAVFIGECCYFPDKQCLEGKCQKGRVTVLGNLAWECTYGKNVSRTGCSLSPVQASSFTGFGEPFFRQPNGLRSPRRVDLPRIARFSPGRVLIRGGNGTSSFAVLLACLTDSTRDDCSIKLWPFGGLRAEEIFFSNETLFDTKLSLPPFQLQAVTQQLDH